MKSIVPMLAAVILASAPEARADLLSKAVREAAEAALRKIGGKVTPDAAEFMTRKVSAYATRHGDDLVLAVRKAGVRAMSVADDAGRKAPQALKFLGRYGDDGLRAIDNPKGLALFARYGDDAGLVLMKHPGIAEPLVEGMGQPAIKALGAISPQNARRLAMMGPDATPEMLGVVGKYGDHAMDFIWRNKGTLAGTAALAGFLANPEPYLNGANTLAGTVADATIKPAFETAGDIAREGASLLTRVLTIAALAVAGLAVWFVKELERPRARSLWRIARKLLAK